MGKGNTFENELVSQAEEASPNEVNIIPCGYSGNAKYAAEDFVVTDGRTAENHHVEVKTTKKDHVYLDADELERLVARTNANTAAYIAVSFNNRELLVVRYFHDVTGIEDYSEKSVAEKFAALAPDCFDPRVTDSGRLALTKPSLDDWNSVVGGSSDVEALLSGLGIVTEDSFDWHVGDDG